MLRNLPKVTKLLSQEPKQVDQCQIGCSKPCYSKCGPQTNSTDIIWEFARHAESQVQPQTHPIRFGFNKTAGDLSAKSHKNIWEQQEGNWDNYSVCLTSLPGP